MNEGGECFADPRSELDPREVAILDILAFPESIRRKVEQVWLSEGYTKENPFLILVRWTAYGLVFLHLFSPRIPGFKVLFASTVMTDLVLGIVAGIGILWIKEAIGLWQCISDSWRDMRLSHRALAAGLRNDILEIPRASLFLAAFVSCLMEDSYSLALLLSLAYIILLFTEWLMKKAVYDELAWRSAEEKNKTQS